MIETGNDVGLNASPKELTKAVVIEGKKIDPFTGGLRNTDSIFLIKPNEGDGIRFCLGDLRAPCHPDTLEAFDSIFGRMLRIHMENGAQIVLVEHMLSALALLGIQNVDIVVDSSCYGPMTSQIFGQEAYWVPIKGPGVSGFIHELRPHCRKISQNGEKILSISRRVEHRVTEIYKGNSVERKMTMEPADKLIIQVDSARQPEVRNNPDAASVTIAEGDDIENYLEARPMMRLDRKWKEWILFILNLRSFALTRETYFRSKRCMSREQVVARMDSIFQSGQNEHLYHTAISDFPGELATFLCGERLRGRIRLSDTNHLFRVEGLRHLLRKENLTQ